MTRVDRREKSIFRLGRLWLLDMLRRLQSGLLDVLLTIPEGELEVALYLALPAKRDFQALSEKLHCLLDQMCLGGSALLGRARGERARQPPLLVGSAAALSQLLALRGWQRIHALVGSLTPLVVPFAPLLASSTLIAGLYTITTPQQRLSWLQRALLVTFLVLTG
jgi:hypothetical protein